MGQKPIELILLRQLATRLALPVLLVDTQGTLVFRNPRAEEFLGVRPGERPDEIPMHEIAAESGRRTPTAGPSPPTRSPSSWRYGAICRSRQVVHDRAGTPRRLVVTAIPLNDSDERALGAVAIFWKG